MKKHKPIRAVLSFMLAGFFAAAALHADDRVATDKDSITEQENPVLSKFTFTGTPKTDRKIYDGKVKDGIYEADTPPSSYGHKGYITLTVKNGQVVRIVFYQKDPKTNGYKDENYGKEYGTQFGPDTFQKAQISVEGGKQYPVRLIETQNLYAVDAVSGATYNLSVFRSAAMAALAKGKTE